MSGPSRKVRRERKNENRTHTKKPTGTAGAGERGQCGPVLFPHDLLERARWGEGAGAEIPGRNGPQRQGGHGFFHRGTGRWAQPAPAVGQNGARRHPRPPGRCPRQRGDARRHGLGVPRPVAVPLCLGARLRPPHRNRHDPRPQQRPALHPGQRGQGRAAPGLRPAHRGNRAGCRCAKREGFKRDRDPR